jgi:nucleotide-binding universal stress UspA family protein
MSGITVGIDGSAHSSRALEWALNEGATRERPGRLHGAVRSSPGWG